MAEQSATNRDEHREWRVPHDLEERGLDSLVVGHQVLEHGGLIDRPAKVERDQEKRERAQQRNSPRPREDLLVGERQEEHQPDGVAED